MLSQSKSELNSEMFQVALSVVDGGEGISESDRDLVFQPFYRGAGKQNINDCGLDLTVVWQIGEAHGGFVELLPKSEVKSAVNVICC